MRGQLVLICLVLVGLVAGAPAGVAKPEVMPAGERPEACRAGDSSSYVAPLPDGLPILQSASDRAKAVFALPYALMAEDSRDRSSDRLAPYGYYRGIDSDDLFADISRASLALTRLTGFYATTFLHCSADALVIVYRSATTFDGRDWIAAFARQMLGGESSLALRFFEGVRERNPGYSIAIVGHSSGGALASYVADVADLPSVTLNPIRTDAAVANNGRKQFNIFVAGDVYADPNAGFPPSIVGVFGRVLYNPVPMSGTELWLLPSIDYPTHQLHQIDVILDELVWLLGLDPAEIL